MDPEVKTRGLFQEWIIDEIRVSEYESGPIKVSLRIVRIKLTSSNWSENSQSRTKIIRLFQISNT